MSEHQVLDAVRALHDVSTDDEQRTAVSSYLSSFQRSLLSWNVSLNLLSRPASLESQLFAAQTLKEKLRCHSWQLSHDSWQPIRSCVVSVLQCPCEPALEVQVSLCLVALIILTSSDDFMPQLRQALSPSRLLLVLQLLGEEVGSDSSVYEPAPGIDKVAWWLQTRRSVGSLGPVVLPIITECVCNPQRLAQASSDGSSHPAAFEACGKPLLLQRALSCAAAWFRLGVLFTLPSATFEGILEFALKACRDGEWSVVPSACEALAEAFERCPDALLVHLQPRLLELSSLALHPPCPSESAPAHAYSANSTRQQSLITLFVTFVQSCADSIVRSGRSDLLQALFAMSHAAKEDGEGVPGGEPHDFAAAHVVDTVATIGRALVTAVEDEGASLPVCGASAAGVSALLKGMMQAYLDGVLGLLPLHQEELEKRAQNSSGPQGCGLEHAHEAYALAAQLVGTDAFTSAIAAYSAGGTTTHGGHSRDPASAATLSALVNALSSGCLHADADDTEDVPARGGVGGSENGHVSSQRLAAGLLELMQTCVAQAQSSEAAGQARVAARSAIFEAMPVFVPLLQGLEADTYAATLLQIAACAQHVLRTDSQKRNDPGHGPLANLDSGGHGGSSSRDTYVSGMSSGHGVSASPFSGSGDGGSVMDIGTIRCSASLSQDGAGEKESSGVATGASAALVHVMHALRGTAYEEQLVSDTLVLLQLVPLPPASDSALLSAAFLASTQSAVRARSGAQRESSQAGLREVAGRLAVQVAEDFKRTADAAAHALRVIRSQKSAEASVFMDSRLEGEAGSQGSARASSMHDAHAKVDTVEVTQHVRRSAALLLASCGGGSKIGGEEGPEGGMSDKMPAAAVPAHALLARLVEAVPAVTAVLGADASEVTTAQTAVLRRAWGRAVGAAVSLDAAAAVGLLPTVFDVIAGHASVDVLVDWQSVLAVMIDTYLPRNGGHAPTADRVLLALQKIWTLPELQLLPCPGEADMIPEASIASSVLCSHVARSALTPSSWLSMESVVPLVEAGTARCSMAAAANLKHVATAALAALLHMLSASASLPASSLSPLAGCVLRGGGTMMMGFTCALTAPGASQRVLKLTQLLLQLTAVVARAVPLLSPSPFISLPQLPHLPLPKGHHFQGPLSIPHRTLTPENVASGVSYVMLWLKHALTCVRRGMLHNHTPDSICNAWQPLLYQAILAGLQPPLNPGVSPTLTSHSFSASGAASMDALLSPTSTIASTVSQQTAIASSASPFVGLPAAAAQLSSQPSLFSWGSLGPGTRFGSALRADPPFAAQLSPHMSSAALFAEQYTSAPAPEAFNLSDTLASAPCRALKKAIRAIVASLAAPQATAGLLSDGLSSIPFAPFASAPAAPAALQQVFQPALYLTGNAFAAAQHAFPAMPLNAASPLLLPHVLAPAPLQVPMNPHVMHPMAVASAAHTPLTSTPIFAASAAPAAYLSHPYPISGAMSSAVPVMQGGAVGVPCESLAMVTGAVSHGPGLAHMQAQALGLTPQVATPAPGDRSMHAAPVVLHAMAAGGSAISMGQPAGVSHLHADKAGRIGIPMMGSLEQGMEAVIIGANGVGAGGLRMSQGSERTKLGENEHV